MQKLGLVVGFGCVVFVGVFAYVVASRIDQVTIALLLGALLGFGVGMPTSALLTYLLLQHARRDQRDAAQPVQPPTPVSPAANAGYFSPAPAGPVQPALPATSLFASPADAAFPLQPALPRPRRSFYVVGDDGNVSEAQ